MNFALLMKGQRYLRYIVKIELHLYHQDSFLKIIETKHYSSFNLLRAAIYKATKVFVGEHAPLPAFYGGMWHSL